MNSIMEMMNSIDINTDNDENEQQIESEYIRYREELDVVIEERVENISPEEEQIMSLIQETLYDHELGYIRSEKQPLIVIPFGNAQKPLVMHVFLRSGILFYRFGFPFKIIAKSFPVVAMFTAKWNYRASPTLKIDTRDASLVMEHCHKIDDPDKFDKNICWTCIEEIIKYSLMNYAKLEALSRGVVTGDIRKIYRSLLKAALEYFSNEDDDDDQPYWFDELLSDKENPETIDESKETTDENQEAVNIEEANTTESPVQNIKNDNISEQLESRDPFEVLEEELLNIDLWLKDSKYLAHKEKIHLAHNALPIERLKRELMTLMDEYENR